MLNKLKNRVVALCGSKSSGKDSLFESLHNLVMRVQPKASNGIFLANVKFAGVLNDILHTAIGRWVEYWNRGEEFTISREDIRKALVHHIPGVEFDLSMFEESFTTCWRELAQLVGTEVIRGQYPEFFVRHVEGVLSDYKKYPYVASILTDVRFLNELGLADVAVSITRRDFHDLVVKEEVHESEQLGQAIDILSNRYMLMRDLGLEKEASYWLKHLRDLMKSQGAKEVLHMVSDKDADGNLVFSDLETAFYDYPESLEDLVESEEDLHSYFIVSDGVQDSNIYLKLHVDAQLTV